MLAGKRIILGISGGIAAYKTPLLVRQLVKLGAEVQCIMTPSSTDFVSQLALATVSNNPVLIDFWNKRDGSWTNHVDLGLWADLIILAPLTANSIAKMATGLCDNLLMATYLSAKCPTMVFPAMDLDMYAHHTSESNMKILAQNGVIVQPAEYGELASGLTGKGRMPEPEQIVEKVLAHFKTSTDLTGKKILITAGPTYEGIDPVRFIGNHSSGKMGFEIAKESLRRGAEVILITGPTHCQLHHPNLTRFDITSASEMLAKVQAHFSSCDGGIFSAAVADYRPKEMAPNKLKKNSDALTIELVKNPDILEWAGKVKTGRQFLIGFALESVNALDYGREKLERKNLDSIVVNSLADDQAGFGFDTNKITILGKNNKQYDFELSTKAKTAENIVQHLVNNLI
jgi:phosphopantothenoylcysteine decarboxylase/phosphopantothenate--cysteine ligase